MRRAANMLMFSLLVDVYKFNNAINENPFPYPKWYAVWVGIGMCIRFRKRQLNRRSGFHISDGWLCSTAKHYLKLFHEKVLLATEVVGFQMPSFVLKTICLSMFAQTSQWGYLRVGIRYCVVVGSNLIIMCVLIILSAKLSLLMMIHVN